MSLPNNYNRFVCAEVIKNSLIQPQIYLSHIIYTVLDIVTSNLRGLETLGSSFPPPSPNPPPPPYLQGRKYLSLF